MLYPVTRLGEDAQLTILDSSTYAEVNEVVTWWQLVARCQDARGVLVGYYAIPDHMDEPLNTVVDPLGMEVSTRGAYLVPVGAQHISKSSHGLFNSASGVWQAQPHLKQQTELLRQVLP